MVDSAQARPMLAKHYLGKVAKVRTSDPGFGAGTRSEAVIVGWLDSRTEKKHECKGS